jgi:sterol desaturase/sphingolipid hydroxylase (fatty acid hydroxylase superfamily)
VKPWRNPYVVVPAWCAVAAGLFATCPSSASLALGVASWPLAEYAVHRWAMHALEAVNARAYRKAHGVHHGHPLDASHYVVPPFAVATTATSAAVVAPSYAAGLLLAMAAYDLVHMGAHGLGPLGGLVPAALVRHHEGHHANQAANFSVTFPPLDSLMGTRAP